MLDWLRGTDRVQEPPITLGEAPQAVAPGLPEPAPDPLPAPVPGTCANSDCPAAAVHPCSYSDGHGRVCGVTLCPGHVGKVAPSGALCRRHAAVARLLAAQGGGLVEVHRPDLDDRWFTLVAIVGEQMDAAVLDMLSRRYQSVPGTVVASDTSLRAVRRGAVLGWERGWAAYSATGYLARVGLRAERGEPPVLQLLVDQKPAFTGVPDWIARRLAGAGADPADRERFAARHLASLDSAFQRGVTS